MLLSLLTDREQSEEAEGLRLRGQSEMTASGAQQGDLALGIGNSQAPEQ